ncbi:hypothetical protein QN277_001723 [Acacia crassicarpa]|uniref:Uncharacterized protein n=1 Tax=Acacia crassicarpa TaxID=499986 RepID=A0AAE1N7N8_9FABA|nr:hypothetical protein QN277_001723 [Acacia crassicarpa]
MEFKKVGVILLLLLCGIELFMGRNDNMKVGRVEACPLYCYADAAYMTCTSSGNEHLPPKCNCCLAGKGCTIYKADGSPYCSST